MLSDHESRRPLDDDLDFLAGLSDLDRGLTDSPPPAESFARLAHSEAASPSAGTPVDPPDQPSLASRRALADLLPLPPGPGPASGGQSGIQEFEFFYGFDQKPFGPSTDPAFFYRGASHDHAAQTLLSAICGRQGLTVLTGPAGAGKTLVCRTVMEELDRRTLASLVSAAGLSTEELLRALLADFGVITRGRPRGSASAPDLTKALADFLQSLAPLQAGAVVILDQADQLAAEVLQQIGAWAESDTELHLLQVILVGEPPLVRRLRRRALRRLDQKIRTRISVEPLTVEELDGYIAHRLAVAGRNSRVEFDANAVARIHRYTQGLPSRINQLCDRALAKGSAALAATIDSGLIDEAAAELGMKPVESRAAKWFRRTALALAFVLLAIAGAAGAAMVFQGPFDRLVQLWNQTPLP